MTTFLMPPGRARGWTNAGVPAAGCLLYTYEAGTSTPKATYTDAAGLVPHTNPIVLDAKGEALIYWDGNYKIDLKTALGVQITGYPIDNYETPLMPGTLSAQAGSGLIGFVYATAYGVGSIGRWLKDLALAAGSSFVGFTWATGYLANTIGWGVQTAGNSYNFLRSIPRTEWAAIAAGSSSYDVTALLTTAIATYKDVFVPAGVYSVDPDIGVILVNSMRLRGAGQNQTIFAATAQGGTLGELANYSKGSIFKRAFTPGVANARVDTVHLSDFAVVMNHPSASVTTTEIQIAIDLRHVGRFVVELVWVGNIAPIGGPMVKTDPAAYASQGYGIVAGNINTGDVSYCGGEVGSIRNCSAYGAYKPIVIDEQTLSPLSGAHAIDVIACDIQGGHQLLGQEQQYTSGFVWDKNTIQDVRRRPGDVSATYVMRIAGYDNDARAGYIEAGVADHMLRFDSASDNNRVCMTHYSATTIGVSAFSDVGRRNRIECRKDSGTLAGGVDSKGLPIVRFDRGYEECSMVTHWDGAAMIVDDGFGMTVTRPTAAGDYLWTFDLPFIAANCYTFEVGFDTNVSGHGGTFAVVSHGTANIRIQFYSQNGATTTAIDPRFVFLRIKQI